MNDWQCVCHADGSAVATVSETKELKKASWGICQERIRFVSFGRRLPALTARGVRVRAKVRANVRVRFWVRVRVRVKGGLV
jgi:hypothetical protein